MLLNNNRYIKHWQMLNESMRKWQKNILTAQANANRTTVNPINILNDKKHH